MTIRVSVTHHEQENPRPLVAQVFDVTAVGAVNEVPSSVYGVAPGATAILHLHAGNVLVVREVDPAAGGC